MIVMSDVPSYVRKVAARVLGPKSPSIDMIVEDVVEQVITGLRNKTLQLADVRDFAKRQTQKAATATFAAERAALLGGGRQASPSACRKQAAAARAESVRELLAALTQLPMTVETRAPKELHLVA